MIANNSKISFISILDKKLKPLVFRHYDFDVNENILDILQKILYQDENPYLYYEDMNIF